MTLLWLLGLAFGSVFARRLARRQSWRWAWLDTTLILALFSVACSEALAGLGLLTRPALGLCWALFCGAWLRGLRGLALPPIPSAPPLPLALLALGTALTAAVAAPSNWDSMTYHLPRIEHWIEQASLQPYPTSILRQLFNPPGAELLMLQVRLLHGSDLFVNGIQWLAYLGCALAASLAAGQLGASRTGQQAAALCAATLPMAVLQSSSTQNDLVVSYWLAAFVCYSLRGEVRASAFSLAMGVLTKGTAYLFFPPFAAWLWLRTPPSARLRCLLWWLGAVLALNALAWQRNLALWPSPLGGSDNVRCAGSRLQAAQLNGLRNLAIELILPIHSWNLGLEKAVLTVSRAWQLDPQMPGATFEGIQFAYPFVPPEERARHPGSRWMFLTHEDYGSNPLHLALSLAIFILAGRRWPGYRGSLLAGWLLLSGGVRWSPWICRLHLPGLVMACPLLGAYLEGLSTRSRRVLLACLWLYALPPLLANSTRPWFGSASIFRLSRAQQYLSSAPEKWQDYQHLVGRVQGLSGEVGLKLGVNCGEYPLHVLLQRPLHHVQVDNLSAPLGKAGPAPEWVIATQPLSPPYRLIDQWGSLSLWHADVSATP